MVTHFFSFLIYYAIAFIPCTRFLCLFNYEVLFNHRLNWFRKYFSYDPMNIMGFNPLIFFYYDFHGKNKHFKTENIT